MKKEIDKSIGERIKTRRKDLKITGIQIHDAVGISTGNLSELEAGRALPSSSALIGLSNVLQCSIDWILTGKTSKSEFSLDYWEVMMLTKYKKLSCEDQEEIMDIIDLKLSRALKREETSEILSNTKNA